MKKSVIKNSVLAGIVVLGIAVALPFIASAVPARAQEAQTVAQEKRDAAQVNAEEHQQVARLKLEGAKLKSCQNREKAITNIMMRLADRGQKQLNLFSTIANRVEQFYVDKGISLATYDTLVANVATAKSSAQAVVDSVKSKSVDFTCTGDDPKSMANSFKDDLKTEIESLKTYRTSIKDLIVGVKSAQGTAQSSDEGVKQ